MKSYFAKLAARATLANAPLSSAVSTSKTQDPFADTPIVASPASPPGIAQPSRPQSPPGETPLNVPPPKSGDRLRARTERIDSDTGQQKQNLTRSLSDPVRLEPTVEHISEVTPPLTSHTPENRRRPESRNLTPEPVQQPTQLTAQVNEVPRVTPPVVSKEARQSKATKEPDTDEREAELKHEQSVLLRKADAFMSGIFERRAVVTPREADTEDERSAPAPAANPMSSREQVTRLQPAPKPSPVAEAVEEQPSLVIGKLTVEVMPTPPQPVTPARQVVVVRGGGAGRRGGVQSSQRFGLGQF